MNATPKRAVIYCRISDDRGNDSLGVIRQEEDGRRVAKDRGWQVLEVIVDNDLSASGVKRRPGFDRVVDLVTAGSVDAVIAWTLDRLTRNRRDTVRLIEAAGAAGVVLALVRGSDLDMGTPSGRFTADLLAAVARSEIEVKSDRQKRANEQAAAMGKWRGGRRAFGYEPDGITVREDEAEAVRSAYQWLIDGVSLRVIAKRWNAAGLVTPQSQGDWTGPVVSRCLRKHRYCGIRTLNGVPTGPAQWPALVDAETWATAQAILMNPSRRPRRGARRLLTGIAECGVCGALVWAGGAAHGQPTYRCRASAHIARLADPVDEFVSAVAVARLEQPDALEALTPRNDPSAGLDLAREAGELRKRLTGMAEAFADGTITAEQLRSGTARARTRLESVEASLAATRGIAGGAVVQLAGADDVSEVWQGLEIEVRREIIDTLMTVRLDSPGRGARTFRPETVRIEWKG